jgi:hypothetical protein
MSFFHVSKATGHVLTCQNPQNCPTSFTGHHASLEETKAYRAATWEQEVFSCTNLVCKDFLNRLDSAVQSGFVKASGVFTDLAVAQASILLSRTAASLVAESLPYLEDGELNAHMKSCVWIALQLGGSVEEAKKVLRQLVPEAFDVTRLYRVLKQFPQVQLDDEILSVAGHLWLFKSSPFHKVAKVILLGSELECTSGYTKKARECFSVRENRLLLDSMRLKSCDLPENVLTYDIETDTTFGFGLRPRLSQVTEIALSNKTHSFVISGDEKFILTKFAELLNSQEPGTVLAGWNNRIFDNVALQTRAEFHGIHGWNGVLVEACNYTLFEPVSHDGRPYELQWVTSSGEVLRDADVLQEKALIAGTYSNTARVGLKDFVKSLGVQPIVLDRQDLHLYDVEDRENYAISDSLITLRAFHEIRSHSSLVI